MRVKKRTYVELFAGCGGMSLGIESEGFKRLFANELSPMPASTYAYNLIYKKNPSTADPEDWYTRLYDPDKNGEYAPDPRLHLRKHVPESALNKLKKFDGSMFVGGINQLNQALHSIPLQTLANLNIDILSGGPPCQSFSLAGRRDKNNPRNDLPFEFAKCASLLKPKVILLENVSGILRPFKDSENNKWYAWYEVAKAFFGEGYIPICTHAEAQKYGVPQRRSRFLMVAIRKDIAQKAINKLNKLPNGIRLQWQSTRMALEASWNHFKDDQKDTMSVGPLEFRWIEPNDNWPEMLLPFKARPIDVESVIDGLTNPHSSKDKAYIQILFETFDHLVPEDLNETLSVDEVKNRANRNHSSVVRARFRLLRLLAQFKEKSIDNSYLQSITSKDEVWLLTQDLIFPDDGLILPRKPTDPLELKILLQSLQSKKHSQRALINHKVAPAQLSIPDDYVHYAEDRTLSVREMARIQSFPDWFEFKGKVTTGGQQREYEVPRYTQVGNAVPPLMAKQITKGIRNFLDLVGE